MGLASSEERNCIEHRIRIDKRTRSEFCEEGKRRYFIVKKIVEDSRANWWFSTQTLHQKHPFKTPIKIQYSLAPPGQSLDFLTALGSLDTVAVGGPAPWALCLGLCHRSSLLQTVAQPVWGHRADPSSMIAEYCPNTRLSKWPPLWERVHLSLFYKNDNFIHEDSANSLP